MATTYYLGSHAREQPGVAVSSMAALNNLRLAPGDRVLFEGGETFSGTITLRAEDSGASGQPVVVGSYGTGRATINAGLGSGIVIDNASWIEIADLDLVGVDKQRNQSSGIDAGAYLPDHTKLPHLRFRSMRISGFRYGVELWAWHSTDTVAWPGFRDVELLGLEVFDNLAEGIRVWGTWYPNGDGRNHSHADVRVRECVVHHNLGDPAATAHSGSGIVLSGVDGALIEHCVAHDNGGLGPATGGGPFGIWVFEARACTLQHNVVFRQRTSSTSDGGAFDLDGGASDCVVQYNYSYDNDGPAVALIQFEGAAPLARNVVRYNISENDARANTQGLLYVGQFSSGAGIDQAEIYGNTVVASRNRTGDDPPVVRIENHPRLAGVRLRNNLFVATHSGALLAGAIDQPAIALFQGNNYWGGTLNLANFRRGGQETLADRPTGLRVDPQFSASGVAPVITSPAQFADLTRFRLAAGSPVARAGLDLARLFGLDAGPHDFFGQPLSLATPAVGAAGPAADEIPLPSLRLVNLSMRSPAGRDDQTLILGFVIAGRERQSVLVRALGPGLAAQGMGDRAMIDPQLTLFRAQTQLAENDNWSGESLARAFAAVGAFPLAPGSADAVVSESLPAGIYTAHLSSATPTSNIGLLELYETGGEARFVNVSARTQVGIGADILIAGFVLSGTGEKTLLLRGAGPSLASVGVPASRVLKNPRLMLYRESVSIGGNDDWGGGAGLQRAFLTVGASAFESTASADAALLVRLGPGLYTVHVSGVNGTTGVALAEIYEVP